MTILLLFLFHIAFAQDYSCSGKICGMKTGYYVQEVQKSFLYIGITSLSDLCLMIDGFELPFCAASQSGWITLNQELRGVVHLSFLDHSGEIVSEYHFFSQVNRLPLSLGWQELLLLPYGSVASAPEKIELKLLSNEALTRDAAQVRLHFINAKDIKLDPFVSDVQIGLLEGGVVEPGSWFLESSLFTFQQTPTHQSFVNKGYVEYVLSPEDIQKYRLFVSIDSYSSQIPYIPNQIGSSSLNNICIWGSDKLDGQKNIWLQQMAFLDRKKFQVTYIVSLLNPSPDDQTENISWVEGLLNGEVIQVIYNGMAMKVREFPHVSMHHNPFEVIRLNPEDFSEVPNDQSTPFSSIWDGSLLSLTKYILHRLEEAKYIVEQVSPRWCQHYLSKILHEVSKFKCDITVYEQGNTRGFSSDSLLIAVSRSFYSFFRPFTLEFRLLGIPSLGELVNLFVENVPDVIVAPSHYAAEDSSVKWAKKKVHSLMTVVIPPGVDLDRFQMTTSATWSTNAIFVIGFVGRLSIEKNVGLFLLGASRLLVDCPVCRFWIIGDGPLRTQLQELVNRLEISWAVKFLGWISSQDLPEVLSKISILVNPSLRAWSETFCIANIEAMAMRIPIVTFAVGGIGEYIRQPLVSGNKLYTVGPNAIILNNASPLAISEAVMVLIRNKTLRLEIGDNAYETVRAQFTVSSQIKLYEQLYSFLTNK